MELNISSAQNSRHVHCEGKQRYISIESLKTVSANNKEKLCAEQEGTNISTSIAWKPPLLEASTPFNPNKNAVLFDLKTNSYAT